MKEWQIIMGMPVVVDVRDNSASEELVGRVFDYFRSVDVVFSTYKSESEISRINRGLVTPEQYSSDMREIFRLAQETKEQTQGYFDIKNQKGEYDPSGIVKGWAIHRAAQILLETGMKNFSVEAGGDIQVQGLGGGEGWRVGIRNPFNKAEIVKTLHLNHNEGVATSGSYE